MGKWLEKSMKLPKNHGWKARPGYNVFIADRGAVRFDFPDGWTLTPGEVSARLHDKPPPDDDCVLEVSFLRLPPVDLSGLPLTGLVSELVKRERRSLEDDLRKRDAWTGEMALRMGSEPEPEIVQVKRPDLELAWTEYRVPDPVELREAVHRVCLGRGNRIQVFITFAFWPEHAEKLVPVWEEVLRSLQLGNYFKDLIRRDIH